jgi:hypothetical protein
MRTAALVVLFAAGVGGGYFVGRRHAPTEATRTVVVERTGTREVVTREVGADTATMRAIVREELGRAAAAPPSPVLNDPAAQVAFDNARAVVDSAIAAGVWTDRDRDAVRANLASLSREQFDELNRALVPALNDGRLRRAFTGIPL